MKNEITIMNEQLTEIFEELKRKTAKVSCKDCLFCIREDKNFIAYQAEQACQDIKQNGKTSLYAKGTPTCYCIFDTMKWMCEWEINESMLPCGPCDLGSLPCKPTACLAFKIRVPTSTKTDVELAAIEQKEFLNNIIGALRLLDVARRAESGELADYLKAIKTHTDNDRRQELLEHYSKTSITTFEQYDGFVNCHDDITPPDKDGDWLCWHTSDDLMSGVYAVRILITRGTKKADACRIINKLTELITKHNGDFDGTPEPDIEPKDIPSDKQIYMHSDFAIKINGSNGSYTCGLCGKRTDTPGGPELFLRDSLTQVCHECGKKYSPLLVYMIEATREEARQNSEPDDIPF